MYNFRPNLYLGFHGCDEAVRDSLVKNPNEIKKSSEKYDWLGEGFYVWENNLKRALQWAKDKKKRNPERITKPSVVGVIYTLDNCLDFTDSASIDTLADYYDLFVSDLQAVNKSIPENRDSPGDKHKERVLRELDRAVINYLTAKSDEIYKAEMDANGYSAFSRIDTVRGVFTEGGEAFPGAGIQKKNHIQISIRNLNCIKGFFIPREEQDFPFSAIEL